jgi:hypothetical protein
MSKLKVQNGNAFCERCGKDVTVTERRGDTSKAEKPHVLVDDHNHVLGQRYVREGEWTKPAVA